MSRRIGLPLAFGITGGPLAWFLQFNACYALTSSACFLRHQRLQLPLDRYAWSGWAMAAITAAAVVVALAAALASWHALRATRGDGQGGSGPLTPDGSAGGMRFLALWGIALGIGAALTSLMTGIGFVALPPCAG